MTITDDATSVESLQTRRLAVVVSLAQIEGVQIFRDLSAGPVYQPGWLVRCQCGYKIGPYVGIETAELMRERHETSCPWLLR